MNKKAQVIDTIFQLVPVLVAVGIVIIIGLLIMSEIRDQVVDIQSGDWCDTGWTYVATNQTCCNSTGGNCEFGTANSNMTLPGFSDAWNGTGEVQTAMSDIPGWLPIIVVTVIGAALLFLVQLFRSKR